MQKSLIENAFIDPVNFISMAQKSEVQKSINAQSNVSVVDSFKKDFAKC